MAAKMIIQPWKCIGCSTCTLNCSFARHGVFNPNLANIRVYRDEFNGTFELRLSSGCSGCKQCARVCPSGALQLVEVPDDERQVHSR